MGYDSLAASEEALSLQGAINDIVPGADVVHQGLRVSVAHHNYVNCVAVAAWGAPSGVTLRDTFVGVAFFAQHVVH